MATQTRIESTNANIQMRGKTADLNNHVKLEKFNIPVSQAEYHQAVSLVHSKLDSMVLVNALFTLNLGPNHPEILIDARLPPATLTTDPTTEPLDAQVYIRPTVIKRFVDGLMEARYALNWGHIVMLSGPTRIGVKFVDRSFGHSTSQAQQTSTQ